MRENKKFISASIRFVSLGDDDYQIQDLDPALEKLLSLSRKELKGSKLKELFSRYPSSQLFSRPFWERVKKQFPCGVFDWFLDPPGTLFRVFVDHSEKELCLLLSELPSPSENTTLFQTLIHQNPLYVFYRYRLLPKAGFEYVSPSVTAVVGYTPEEHYRNPELGLQIVHPKTFIFWKTCSRKERTSESP